jgi:Tfp pilus assembly protein PilO
MKPTFNHLWVLSGIIWLAALFATYGNHSRIDALATIRENNEQLRKEMLFQHRNDRRLAQIQKTYASYFLPVASIKLGFESVRSQLQALAVQLGLKNLKIECQTAQATEAQVPFSLGMLGDFEKAKRFTSILHRLPHLAIRSSSISVSTPGAEAEIEMELYFQFKIEPEDISGRHPLQAAASLPTAPSAGFR